MSPSRVEEEGPVEREEGREGGREGGSQASIESNKTRGAAPSL